MAGTLENDANIFAAHGFRKHAAEIRDLAQKVREDNIPEHLPDNIRRFSPETKEALEKQGYIIYVLTGESIKTLRETGRQIYLTWKKEKIPPEFEEIESIRSEVAINPKLLFLEDSNNKTLSQQKELINKFSDIVEKKFKGVIVIIGQVPDYLELAFKHLDETTKKGKSEYLFSEKHPRTTTVTKGSSVAHIGQTVQGIFIRDWKAHHSHDKVHVSPLLVPNPTQKVFHKA